MNGSVARTLPRAPTFYELATSSEGRRSSYVRGQNFCVGQTRLDAGEALSETDLPDEHIVLVPEGTKISIGVPGQAEASVAGPALVIVPAGTSRAVAHGAATLTRVFTTRSLEVTARAGNNPLYREPDHAVGPLPDRPPIPGPGTLRIHRAADVPVDPDRFGRIFRTDSLIVNWFAPEYGPRDTDTLSPHVHDDFEQGSVTLRGDYTHHLRSPWTPRLREWRDDQHIRCTSPSVTVIPPGIVHTSRAVGEGVHHLVDVFAPPRADFAERGWVVNAADYARSGT
jgi:mannose-6-phosphate isomerase-like protein (cupin superfamily)